jgi:NTE family protein
MVAGAYGAGMDPERHGRILVELKREDFWDPKFGLGVLAGKKFDALLREMLPVHRFEDCQVPVRISVFDIIARRTRVIETGDLANAIRASCAVPGMFHPVWIDRRPYWDGGILDRPGIAGVPPGRLLYHHISAPAPWSREGRRLAIPKRKDMVTLVLEGLPRANPFRLDEGRRAMDLARVATERALDLPIVDDIVRLTV